MAYSTEELIAISEPDSPVAEAIRCLRTNLRFINTEKGTQAIVITSSVPGEGKTLVTSNLAVITAQSGKKTLLIDGDLRRPNIGRIFKFDSKRGLSTLLEKSDVAFEDIPLYDVGIKNLSILPSGIIPPNPAELLERKIFDKALAILKEHFDRIYIDMSPLLSVTDPVITAKKVDGAILVVMASHTARKAVIRSYNILKDADVKIFGTILNKIHTGAGYYKYHYYYKKNRG